MPLWRFVWTTAVGYLPITALAVYFGTRLEGLSLTDPLVIGTAAALLVLLCGGNWVDAAPGGARDDGRGSADPLDPEAEDRRGAGRRCRPHPGPDPDRVPPRCEAAARAGRPQSRSRPRSTLQTKVTPASSERKRKTRPARRVPISFGGCLTIEVCGARCRS